MSNLLHRIIYSLELMVYEIAVGSGHENAMAAEVLYQPVLAHDYCVVALQGILGLDFNT